MVFKIVATGRYLRDVRRWLTPEEQSDMELFIAQDPNRFPLIPGTGGLRKARWPRPGMGKRGALRTIYYVWSTRESILFLMVYSKSEQGNLTHADKKTLRQVVQTIAKVN